MVQEGNGQLQEIVVSKQEVLVMRQSRLNGGGVGRDGIARWGSAGDPELFRGKRLGFPERDVMFLFFFFSRNEMGWKLN